MFKPELKTLKNISILLGFVSVVNVVLLGIYIIRFCLVFAFLSRFQIAANIVGFTTAFSVSLISYGCYSVYKNHFLRGGVCNLIAGIITIGIYLYYTLGFHLLQQLGLLGYFLLLPAPISGIIGIIMSKEKNES